MTRPHAAPRRTLRLDGRWVGLGLMLVSAAVSVAVLWFAAVLLLAMAPEVVR